MSTGDMLNRKLVYYKVRREPDDPTNWLKRSRNIWKTKTEAIKDAEWRMGCDALGEYKVFKVIVEAVWPEDWEII